MGSSWFGGTVIVLLVIVGYGATARPIYPLPSKKLVGRERQPLQTSRPYNIAHRGSSGELPEETTAAYMRAIEEGADFIESDILATKDGALVCFHDIILDLTTDIAQHMEFSSRRTTYQIQGFNVTGWFIIDFTLEELKMLRVKQRHKFRDQQYNGKFKIITFEEFISIALDAPRVVGIYPEIKDPVFINRHVKWGGGKRFEDQFVATLKNYGYEGSYLSEDWLKQPIFIESFAPTSLFYISNLTNSPKILLIADVNFPTQDTNQTFWEITSDSYLRFVKQYVVGIGPGKDAVVPAVNGYLQTPTDLVAKAHSHNLQVMNLSDMGLHGKNTHINPSVHPYTYQNENQFLYFDFHQDPYAEYDYWINKIGVDGLFTDFTGSLHDFQKWTSPLSQDDDNATKLLHKIAISLSPL